MTDAVKLLSLFWEIMQSQQMWFFIAVCWMVAFGWILRSRIKNLEANDADCKKALAECRASDKSKNHRLDKQDKIISTMSSMIMVLRGYMIARVGMDKNADSLAMAELERLFRGENDVG